MNEFEKAISQYYPSEDFSRIQQARIGIAGAGGLGSNAAVLLVRSGISNLEILDHDSVEASNLNRQQYTLKDLGHPKVDCLTQTLLSINPDLQITAHHQRWALSNADQWFKNCDIILECFDRAAHKRDFVEFYQERTKLLISGNGMAGLTHREPLITKKIKNVILVGDQKTDTAEGHYCFAPRVTQCAALMAQAVIEAILRPKR